MNSRRGACPEPRRGAALLLSLWATAALAALGIAQATRLSLELKWAGRLQERDQAWYLCWTGLEAASDLLVRDPELGWDAPSEPWGQAPDSEIPFNGGAFLYKISDEQARIPLNSAPAEVLLRLPGFTPAAVEGLLARREQGKTPAHPGELAALEGFEADAAASLEPLVTFQAASAVNLNTAPAPVLSALGLSSSFSAQIVAYRDGSDGVPATADDRAFTDVERIVPDLEGALGPLTPEDQAAIGGLISSQRLGVRSSFFRVALDGWSSAHRVRRSAEAIVERGGQGDGANVRGWHEGD